MPLLILLAAGVVLALTLRRTALRVTQDVDWTAPAPAVSQGRWRTLTRVFAVLAGVASALSVYTALLDERRNPDPLLWFAALVLWGITFYCIDRNSRRVSALTRAETLGLLGYLVLVILLGFVYHLAFLQALLPRVGFVVLAALVVFALWRWKRISGLVAVWAVIAVAAMALYSYNITSWRYSFLGDEYSFYNTATTYFGNPDAPSIMDAQGVYDTHPVFSIFIQALGVALYGGDFYSWDIGSVLMILFSAPGVYLLARQLKGTTAALLAVIIYLAAHHMLALRAHWLE